MKRSLALAVCGFSLVLALVGGWLADRQFTTALDTLADQAVLQHQRNLFGYADTLQEVKADDSPHMILADDSGTRYINASDKAFAGQLYFDRQRLIVGSVPCTFALLDQTGQVIYSKLPDTIPESELAALKDADTTTMRLCGQTLLLCDQVAGASGQRVWVWMVTALDTSSAYAVRTATLRQWFLLQAVLTLAALLMVHHTTALQQLNDRQSRFVADLTHELKTPLTSMIGYADLLRGGELPPENQRRAADAIYHESTRLESLSQQLLSLQGLRQEALTLTAVPVAAAFEDVARSLPDCPVTLEKTCPEDAAVSADRVLLADLLRNLVLNAAHASAPGSTVALRCLPAGDHWRLEVADTGCGIPPEALPHLTEPFYRVDKARARADGGSGVVARSFGLAESPPPARLAWALACAFCGASSPLALTRMTSSGVSSNTRLKPSGSTKRTVSSTACTATDASSAHCKTLIFLMIPCFTGPDYRCWRRPGRRRVHPARRPARSGRRPGPRRRRRRRLRRAW